MKKSAVLLLLVLLVPLLASSQIYEPDGLRMPGDWNGFTNTLGMGGDFDLTKISSGTVRWQTKFNYSGVTGSNSFKFVSGGSNDPWYNQWTIGEFAVSDTVVMNTLQSYIWTSNSNPENNTITVTNGKWYTVNWQDNGYAATNAIFMETSSEPVSIDTVVQSPLAANVFPGQSVTITVTVSDTLSAEEKVYIRYSNNDFSTSSIAEVSFTGTTGTATIPALTGTVSYYVFSTTVQNPTTDFDMYTINLNNNGGSNYSYTVASGWTTASAGNWSNAATWTANAVPSTTANLGDVTIAHNVTLDQNAVVNSLVINASTTLDAGSATLSIVDNGAFTNNGTFTASTSTVHFLGDATINGSSTTTFYNIIADGTDDGTDPGGLFIPNTATITNKLTIAHGGYLAEDAAGTGISSSDNLPNYGTGATLAIEGPFVVSDFASGWGESGSKRPDNVEVGATGDVSITIPKSFVGVLRIKGNTFTTNGNLTMKSGSELIVESGSLSGNLTFEREINGSQGWRFLSAPLADVTGSELLGPLWTQGIPTGADASAGTSNVLTYNGSGFVSVSDLSTILSAGLGLAVYVYADDDFNGAADAFPKTLSVTGTQNASSITPTLNAGSEVYTLLGNPYASTIDWDLLTKSNVYNVVYVYDHSVPEYKSWNGTTGGIADGKIAPFQGFLVVNQTSGTPSITIENTDQLTGGSFLKQAISNEAIIQLQAEMDGTTNSTYLSFTENGMEGMDIKDAAKLTPLDFKPFMSVSTFNGESYLDINNLPLQLDKPLEIPLYVSAYQTNGDAWVEKSGEVRLTWPQLSQIPSDWQVELLDAETNSRINLLQTSEYVFAQQASQAKVAYKPTLGVNQITGSTSRFSLVIGPIQTSIESVKELPDQVRLLQNYPNPFNPSTQISFELPQAMQVNITVFDMLGREVATLLSGYAKAGVNVVNWNASGFSSGVYYYRLTAGNTVQTKKMTLIK